METIGIKVVQLDPRALRLLNWSEKIDLLEPMQCIPLEDSEKRAAQTAVQRKKTEDKEFGVRSDDDQYYLIRIK